MLEYLAKEIHFWNSFKYLLREENAILFGQMLNKCHDDEGEGVLR
jgi:hypothetical protein